MTELLTEMTNMLMKLICLVFEWIKLQNQHCVIQFKYLFFKGIGILLLLKFIVIWENSKNINISFLKISSFVRVFGWLFRCKEKMFFVDDRGKHLNNVTYLNLYNYIFFLETYFWMNCLEVVFRSEQRYIVNCFHKQ